MIPPQQRADAAHGFFHDLTLHASLPNRSGKARRALIITYRDLSLPDKEYPDLPAAARVRG